MKAKLKKLLKDKVAKEILSFFYENQGSIDSVGGVTAWVHSDRETVKSILDEMVDLGVLNHDIEGITEGYCYTRDEALMKTVRSLMEEK